MSHQGFKPTDFKVLDDFFMKPTSLWWEDKSQSENKDTALREFVNNMLTLYQEDVPFGYTHWNASKVLINLTTFRDGRKCLDLRDNGMGVKDIKQLFTLGKKEKHGAAGAHQNKYGMGCKDAMATLFKDAFFAVSSGSQYIIGRVGSVVAEMTENEGHLKIYQLAIPQVVVDSVKAASGDAETKINKCIREHCKGDQVKLGKAQGNLTALISPSFQSPYACYGDEALDQLVSDLLLPILDDDSGTGTGFMIRGFLYAEHQDHWLLDGKELCYRQSANVVKVRKLLADSYFMGLGESGWHWLSKKLLPPKVPQKYIRSCSTMPSCEPHKVDIIVQGIKLDGTVVTGDGGASTSALEHHSPKGMQHRAFDFVDQIPTALPSREGDGYVKFCSDILLLEHRPEFGDLASPEGGVVARGCVIGHPDITATQAGIVLVTGNALVLNEGPISRDGFLGIGVLKQWLDKHEDEIKKQPSEYRMCARNILRSGLYPSLHKYGRNEAELAIQYREVMRRKGIEQTILRWGALAMWYVDERYLPVGYDKRSVQPSPVADTILAAMIDKSVEAVYKLVMQGSGHQPKLRTDYPPSISHNMTTTQSQAVANASPTVADRSSAVPRTPIIIDLVDDYAEEPPSPSNHNPSQRPTRLRKPTKAHEMSLLACAAEAALDDAIAGRVQARGDAAPRVDNPALGAGRSKGRTAGTAQQRVPGQSNGNTARTGRAQRVAKRVALSKPVVQDGPLTVKEVVDKALWARGYYGDGIEDELLKVLCDLLQSDPDLANYEVKPAHCPLPSAYKQAWYAELLRKKKQKK